jgi:glycosyltransferase involved in cell wall biosynthesis
MLGVGITTRNRSKVLDWALTHFLNFPSSSDVKIVVVDDNSDADHKIANELSIKKTPFVYIYNDNRRGISGSKNVCLSFLTECDNVFLFDDDCYPKLPNWDVPFIKLKDSFGHLSLIRQLGDAKMEKKSGYNVFQLSQGMCLFFTRKCLDSIKGYDEKFGYYGYEHSDISNRAKIAGFCGDENTAYICPSEAENYLYSLDIDYGFFRALTTLGKFDFKFCASIENNEKKELLDVSNKYYIEKVNSGAYIEKI